jgi:hypothetical protein
MFLWNAICSIHSMAIWTTRHTAPDQAWFEPKYFLALTEDGPPLFNLIGQCFQDSSLTEWNKVVGKQCLNDNDLAKASFKKWTRDYQRQSPGCPKQMTNWSVGLALQRSLHLCWYMNSCNVGHSYLAILTVATSIKIGAANSAGEEQADLLFETQGTSVHVQRQTWLFCHIHRAKGEENNRTHK